MTSDTRAMLYTMILIIVGCAYTLILNHGIGKTQGQVSALSNSMSATQSQISALSNEVAR